MTKILPALVLVTLLPACLPYEGTVPRDSRCDCPEGDADTDTDADGDADSDADTDPQPPILDAAHTGWLNPCCLTCHTRDAHNQGQDPYECAACHGANGAPGGHGQTSGCDSCHGNSVHCGGQGFPIPTACLVCHPG